MQDYVEELAAEAFDKIDPDAWAKAAEIKLHFPSKPNDAAELTRALLRNTALQATFASITGYTLSKWLLKRELIEGVRQSKPTVDNYGCFAAQVAGVSSAMR